MFSQASPKLELAGTFSRLLLLFEFLYYYETHSQGLSFTSLEADKTKREPGTSLSYSFHLAETNQLNESILNICCTRV